MIRGIERAQMSEPDFEADYRLDWRDPQIPPHGHDFYECFCLLTGDIDYFSGERHYRLIGGDVLIVPPNTTHNPVLHRTRSTYERVVLWVRPQLIERLAALDPDLTTLKGWFEGGCLFHSKETRKNRTEQTADDAMESHGSDLSVMFMELARLYTLKPSCYRSSGDALILRMMVEMAHRIPSDMPVERTPEDPALPMDEENETLTALLAYVHANLDRKLSLADLEKRLLTGRQTLARIMRRQLGTSFYQYVLHKRLMLARDLLLTGTPVTHLHSRCGFSDHSCLYRAFIREFGTSPKEYLRQHGVAGEPEGLPSLEQEPVV